MTVTETEAPHASGTSAAALAPPRPATGLAVVLGTGEHRTVGRLWVFTAFVYLLVAGVAGALVGVEKIDTEGLGDVLDADVFAQTYSLHAVAGTFLFLFPLFLGLATSVVPAQVGAPTIAFPRAAAAAYWTYLAAGGVLIASFLADGGPFGSDGEAVELFVAAFIAVLAALTLGAICVGTTAFALRAPGMGLHRAPLFTWSSLVTAAVTVLTLPVLAAVMLLVYVDLRYGGDGGTFLGGSEGVFQRIAWAWAQPNVYLFAIPVLGIVGDIVPVSARTRLTKHRVAMGCIGAFGIFAFGAWAMPSVSADAGTTLRYVGEVPFYAFSFLVVLPLLGFAGLLADTVRRGSASLASPLLWGIAALLMLLAGAANGALVSIEPLDLVETTAQSAQMHYVLLAALLGLFAGLAHWAPRVLGGVLAEVPSKGLAALGLLGTVLLCLPDLISGFLDQLWRLGGVTDDADTVEVLNIVSLAGGALLVLVAIAFLGLVLQAALGDDADADPWGGHTLEWADPAAPPAITSEAPLYDARHGAGTPTTEAQS
ncbi:MAG TPA: cbb3-type cytochrome c oxidase subunit I [Acidimicrobiales bacterium]|nr:cbb3-type cytochrome c oxidase subunit I [Acidimicrobiales bacterium]